MFDFVGKALKGLVLTKEAQDALEARRQAEAQAGGKAAFAANQAAAKAAAERDARLTAVHERAQNEASPDRAELIRRAMEVRRAKQVILAELSDEQREKLVALALKALMGKDTPAK